MIKPTIHLNGSPASSLRDGYMEAFEAVRKAQEALQTRTSPHGRDYYPQGSHALEGAIGEHYSRVQRLSEISSELLELAEHCDSFVK